LNGLRPDEKKLLRESAVNERCKRDALYWLQHHTRTRDDHWRKRGTEPYCKFPYKPYFPKLFELMASERRLFLPKSREMMLSWAIMG
jgi:hypothetical protein